MNKYGESQKSALDLILGLNRGGGEGKSPIEPFVTKFENSPLTLKINVFNKQVYLHLHKPCAGKGFNKTITLSEAEAYSMMEAASQIVKELKSQRAKLETLYPDVDLESEEKDDIPTIPLAKDMSMREKRAKLKRQMAKKAKRRAAAAARADTASEPELSDSEELTNVKGGNSDDDEFHHTMPAPKKSKKGAVKN